MPPTRPVAHLDPARQGRGDVAVVGDDHDGGAGGVQVAQQRQHPVPEAESRLPVGSSASSSGGSPTTARAIATRCLSPPDSWCGRCRSRWARPTRCSAARRAGAARPARYPRVQQAVGDVVERRDAGGEVELLEDEPDGTARERRTAAGPTAGPRRGRRSSTAPAGRPVERADEVQHRRLARAGRPDDGDQLPVLDGQRHRVQRDDPAGVGPADPVEGDERHVGTPTAVPRRDAVAADLDPAVRRTCRSARRRSGWSSRSRPGRRSRLRRARPARPPARSGRSRPWPTPG